MCAEFVEPLPWTCRTTRRVSLSLICSKTVSGGCNDECMTGDDQVDRSAAREAVADARRAAARAQARLAEAAVRYADVRIGEETAAAPDVDAPRLHRPKPGEFVADELSVMLRDQPYQVRCLLARSRRLATDCPRYGKRSVAATWTWSRSG
jgi:hypothetical protein